MSISNTDEYIDGTDIANEITAIKEDINWHEIQIDILKAGRKCADQFEQGLVELKEMLAPLEELETDLFLPLNDVSLIAREEFEDYCFRLAVDCGDISENSTVASFVNWACYAAAAEIDYKTVDFDGEEYLYRS